MNQRSLVVDKINLVFHALSEFNNRLDGRVYDLSGMHDDLDFAADFVLAWGSWAFSAWRDCTTE
jgi:hypothetical protein